MPVLQNFAYAEVSSFQLEKEINRRNLLWNHFFTGVFFMFFVFGFIKFLVLGLGGRFSALGLFVVNIVAVISLSEIAPAALQQHVFWGSLLAALCVFGLGPWSLDRWISPQKRSN